MNGTVTTYVLLFIRYNPLSIKRAYKTPMPLQRAFRHTMGSSETALFEWRHHIH